jgi:hypothetical protein
VRVDVGPHLDLLDLDDLLLLARSGGLFLAFIFQLAEIEDLADRRFGIGRDFNQVKTSGFGRLKRRLDRDFAVVVSFAIDKLDPGYPDI